MSKVCGDCGELKARSEFHRNIASRDGLQYRCKPCARVRIYGWREKNPSRYRAINNSSARRTRRRDPESWRRREVRYASRFPERIRARQLANSAERAGLLVRPSACEGDGCGRSDLRLEKHHDDYAQPLKVRWLCPRCHVVADRLAPQPPAGPQEKCTRAQGRAA